MVYSDNGYYGSPPPDDLERDYSPKTPAELGVYNPYEFNWLGSAADLIKKTGSGIANVPSRAYEALGNLTPNSFAEFDPDKPVSSVLKGGADAIKDYMSRSYQNLTKVPGAAYNALEWASQNVAAPALQEMQNVQTKDWSQEPFIGIDKNTGELTGRLPALSSFVSPYVLGAAPANSLSAGIRLPSGHEGGYHGTHAIFDPTPQNVLGQFFDRFINTGEGAQAYGWGHYFGAKKGTAVSYMPDSSFEDLHMDGQLWSPQKRNSAGKLLGSPGEIEAYDHLANAPILITPNGHAPDVDHAITQLKYSIADRKQYIEDLSKAGPDSYSSAAMRTSKRNLKTEQQALDFIESNRDKFTLDTPGSLYHVEIKPPEESLMHWDRKIKDQEPDVQQKLNNIADVYLLGSSDPAKRAELWKNYQDMKAGDFYRELKNQGSVRRAYPDMTGNGQALSEIMRQEGIPGIRFADQNSRPLVIAKEEINTLNQKNNDLQKVLDENLNPEHPAFDTVREKMLDPDNLATVRRVVSEEIDKNKSLIKDQENQIQKWHSIIHFNDKPINSENDIRGVLNAKEQFDPRVTALTALYYRKDIDGAIMDLRRQHRIESEDMGPDSTAAIMNERALRWLDRNRDKISYKEPDITHNYVIFDPKDLNIIKREPNRRGGVI